MSRSHRRLERIVVAAIALSVSLSATGDEPQTTEAEQTLPGCPEWLQDYEFPQEQFTFVRVKYGSPQFRPSRGGRGDWGRWRTDWPEADRNLAAVVGRHTKLEVAPDGKVLELTDPGLSKYPFLYMAEAGALRLSSNEVTDLRKYLEDGGFLMLDDFWGEAEWTQFHTQIKRVFPNREFKELPLEHKIFHCVFDLQEKPQVPSIHAALVGRSTGRTTERVGAETPHYRALFDDEGRMMVLACHNTDLADGWERESEDSWYYEEFSVKKAYPMGINAIFFALTQ